MKLQYFIGCSLVVIALLWSESIVFSRPSTEIYRLKIGSPLEYIFVAVGGVLLTRKI